MTKKIASFIALFLALDTMPALAAGPYVDLNAELKKTTAMNPVTEKILKDAVAGYDPSKPQKSVAEINKETKDSIKQEQKAQKQAEREEKKAEREDKRNERKEQRAEKKAERAEAKQSEETKIETKEIKELQSEYEDAKATEQSKANRTLTAASTAATGIGGMELAQGLSEQNADKAAEADMNAYISTFRCKYAGGTSVKASMEEIELPGGNDANMMKYRAEYFALAADLKERKNALGLTLGIESIEVLDKSQMGLYDDEFTGITAGNYASLYRAKMLGSETDQALIDEAKKTSKNRVIGGAVAAGAGIIGGVVGDMLINGNKDKNKNKNSDTDNNDDDEYNEYLDEDAGPLSEDDGQLDEDGEPSGEDGGNYNQTAVFSDISEITNQEDCDSVLGYWDDDMKCQCIDATYFNADTQSCESEEFDMGDITIAPDTTEIVAPAKPGTTTTTTVSSDPATDDPKKTVATNPAKPTAGNPTKPTTVLTNATTIDPKQQDVADGVDVDGDDDAPGNELTPDQTAVSKLNVLDPSGNQDIATQRGIAAIGGTPELDIKVPSLYTPKTNTNADSAPDAASGQLQQNCEHGNLGTWSNGKCTCQENYSPNSSGFCVTSLTDEQKCKNSKGTWKNGECKCPDKYTLTDGLCHNLKVVNVTPSTNQNDNAPVVDKGYHKPCTTEDFEPLKAKGATEGWYYKGKCVAKTCDEKNGWVLAKNDRDESQGYCRKKTVKDRTDSAPTPTAQRDNNVQKTVKKQTNNNAQNSSTESSSTWDTWVYTLKGYNANGTCDIEQDGEYRKNVSLSWCNDLYKGEWRFQEGVREGGNINDSSMYRGKSVCVKTKAEKQFQKGTPDTNSSGGNCWCQITQRRTFLSNGIKKVSGPWIYIGSTYPDCNPYCAYNCAKKWANIRKASNL